MSASQITTATAEKVLEQPFVGYQAKIRINWRDILFHLSILATGALLMFLIILLKAKTTKEFSVEPYFFSYAVFVTAFLLSRVITAMFYEKSYASLLTESQVANGGSTDEYEPTVAFVIPCKNEEMEIGESIIQCYQVNYPREKIEVIVVNDGSTDRTGMVLAELKKFYPELKIINWPNQGKRWGMAAGFEIAEAEIIVQMDSDSQMDPRSLRALIAPFRNPEVSAVSAHGIPKNADQNILTKMQTAYYFTSFRILKAAESTFNTVFCCSGCCAAYRKSAVMPILYKWLSESFLGRPVTWGDDRSLTSWLLKTGGRTVYSSQALAYTIVPDTFRKLLKQQLRWKKSWIINSVLTSRFIWKKQLFVSLFYYFPLVLISLLTPIMTFRALIYMPITHGVLPLFHVAGILLITMILVLYYRYIAKDDRHWPYLFLWSLLNLFCLSFIIIWAAVRIQDRSWGTR